jgi:predicted phosphodiesterase
MASTRVLVVSDSHLSTRTPEALDNWGAVVRHVAAGRHDLVLHVGDVTADGAKDPDDLALARVELGRLDARVRAVPGNHDVGDNPVDGGLAGDYEAPVGSERIDRFRAEIGPDRWALDLPGWRVVGLNGLLFGSGLDAEGEQWRWLAEALPPEGDPDPDRRVALVLHKPLAAPPPHEDATPYRYTPPTARERLRAALAGRRLGLVVSGHVHQFARHEHDGVVHLWAPTTWATIPDRFQRALGEKRCGVVELTLHDDGTVDAEATVPDGMVDHVLVDTVPDPYGI